MRVLTTIQKDLDFNKGLFNLLETMKTIAVAQYRALESKIKTYADFFKTAEGYFSLIDLKKVRHPFVSPRGQHQAVVAVTTDSGLLGGLNMDVVTTALEELRTIPGKIIIVGERGKTYVRGTGVPSVAFPGIREQQRLSQAMQLRDFLVKRTLAGEFGQVKIVYPKPISFTVQKVETVSFLPFAPAGTRRTDAYPEVIVESRMRDIVEYLVHLWMGRKIYEIFGLSRLAEFAARYVHLEESVQKLKDLDKKVKLEYFRVRHELVDRTMRELFAGRAIYGKQW